MQPATKTYQQDGKWIERTKPSTVLLCACGKKYIKTRPRQSTCITCMYAGRDTRSHLRTIRRKV